VSVHPGYFSDGHAIESTRETVFVTVHDCMYVTETCYYYVYEKLAIFVCLH